MGDRERNQHVPKVLCKRPCKAGAHEPDRLHDVASRMIRVLRRLREIYLKAHRREPDRFLSIRPCLDSKSKDGTRKTELTS
jgi:hypothetical protein